jgi:hypothetical protein
MVLMLNGKNQGWMALCARCKFGNLEENAMPKNRRERQRKPGNNKKDANFYSRVYLIDFLPFVLN